MSTVLIWELLQLLQILELTLSIWTNSAIVRFRRTLLRSDSWLYSDRTFVGCWRLSHQPSLACSDAKRRVDFSGSMTTDLFKRTFRFLLLVLTLLRWCLQPVPRPLGVVGWLNALGILVVLLLFPLFLLFFFFFRGWTQPCRIGISAAQTESQVLGSGRKRRPPSRQDESRSTYVVFNHPSEVLLSTASEFVWPPASGTGSTALSNTLQVQRGFKRSSTPRSFQMFSSNQKANGAHHSQGEGLSCQQRDVDHSIPDLTHDGSGGAGRQVDACEAG